MNSLDIRKLKKELETQDSVGTADPIYCVYEKVKTITTSENCEDWCWVDDEGDEIGNHEDVTQYAKDNLEDYEFKNFSVDCDEDSFESQGLTFNKYHYKMTSKFVTPCFTRKAAQEFIDTNKHNLDNPYIYVHSLWNNSEMGEIRDHFLESEDK